MIASTAPRAESRSIPPQMALLGAICLTLVAGCGAPESFESLPDGDRFVGRSEGMTAWVEPLLTMRESRLVVKAEQVSSVLEDCAEVEGSCPAGSRCDIVQEIACRGGAPDLEQAWAELGDWDWTFSRTREGRTAILRGRRGESGALQAELDLPAIEGDALSNLLMPAEDGPGATRLGGEGLLVHLRFRPAEGLEVGSLLQSEETGAGLFQLQSDLFLAAVLAGNWELAVHTPPEGNRFPPMSIALDFRSRGPAVVAMEQLLENLTGVWPVRRDPYRLESWDGECLGNLNVLPELAPCYVATDSALVIGWNRASLETALSTGPEELDPSSSGGLFQLSRFAAADRRLARSYGSEDERVLSYPWSRMAIFGNRVGQRFVFRIELAAGGTS